MICPQHESRERQAAKNVDRIADAGVKAAGHQRTCLGLHAEGPSQLNPRQCEQQKTSSAKTKSGDAQCCPRRSPELQDNERQKENNHCERYDIQFQKNAPGFSLARARIGWP